MRSGLAALLRRRTGARRPGRAGTPASVDAIRDAIGARGLDAELALALGDALEAAGRRIEAVEALHAANRLRPDPALERRLVRLRHAAFADLDRSASPPWPPDVPEDATGAQGPPVVRPDELTPGMLRRGILRHGCVWARGLVPPARVVRLREAIDRAFEAHDECARGRGHSAWFDPLEAFADDPGGATRGWVREGMGVLTADSPRAFYEFVETLKQIGIDRLVAGYLGERPALSADKCTLRRVDATPAYAAWHQDGAFMGKGIRTVNPWVALSDCGRDAPGLDVIPVRVDRLLPTGEEGAIFDWAVAADTIARELPGVAPWRPEFQAGDVLFFDELCLHRTAAEAGMTRPRYAIESWLFASSVYPVGTQTPILL